MIFGEHPFDKEKASIQNLRYKAAINNPDDFWGGEDDEEADADE